MLNEITFDFFKVRMHGNPVDLLKSESGLYVLHIK
jgi:hypothetical protein